MCEVIWYRIDWQLHKSLNIFQTCKPLFYCVLLVKLCQDLRTQTALPDPLRILDLIRPRSLPHTRTISSCSSEDASGLGSSSILSCLAMGPTEMGLPTGPHPSWTFVCAQCQGRSGAGDWSCCSGTGESDGTGPGCQALPLSPKEHLLLPALPSTGLPAVPQLACKGVLGFKGTQGQLQKNQLEM